MTKIFKAQSRSKSHPSELRCVCHRLLARIEDRTLILRCPRCKRQMLIPLDKPFAVGEVEVNFLS
jgi:Zn finger protein HypA/HybF involved in hydrogenase expression